MKRRAADLDVMVDYNIRQLDQKANAGFWNVSSTMELLLHTHIDEYLTRKNSEYKYSQDKAG